MSNFHINQRVVCIDDGPPRNKHPRLATKNRLIAGQVYIIRGFDDERLQDTDDGMPGLLLEGVVDPIVPPYKQELGWHHSRFRPVIERKTDISVFTAMLTPRRADEKVQ